MGDREEETEEDGEPRPLEIVGHDHADGVLGELRVRLGERRIGGRVARREQEEVRRRLRPVAERERDEVAQAARRGLRGRGSRTRRGTRRPPRRRRPTRTFHQTRLLASARRRRPRALARRAGREPAAERGREEERREREDEPEEASPAALTDGWVDLDVDGVVLLDAEPRVRVRGEEHVRAHLRRVADVRRDEVVQAVRHLALDEHGEPVHEADDERRDPAERHPDEERDREEEPEEDRQTAAVEVVADDESDRPLLDARHGRILAVRAERLSSSTPGVRAASTPRSLQRDGVARTTAVTPRSRLRSRDGRAERRRARGRGHPRPAPAHAAPLVPHARAGRLPEGRAPPADRLVQAARRAHEARVAARPRRRRAG